MRMNIIALFKRNAHCLLMAVLFLTVLLLGGLSTDSKAGCWFPVEPIYSVNEYDDVRCKDMSSIDLSDRPNLPATLWFSEGTIWPESNKMPPGCDPNEIMTNAMNPGLGIRALHLQGFTGSGVNVAIIDQPMYLDHPEFAGKIVAYYDTTGSGPDSSMHGPAVASLLVGNNCGTAPEADVYYVAAPSWLDDASYEANGLDWIIAQNEVLGETEKIRVISVSASPSERAVNGHMWNEACSRAEAEGILVLDVTRFAGVCWYDANDPDNVTKCTPGFPGMGPYFDPEEILVPASPRTTAEEVYEGDFSYQYTGRGGKSWSMPYCAGVLAVGWQIRPELTDERMVDYLFQTAYVNPDGAKIINPPAFISFLNSDQPVIGINTRAISFYAIIGGGNSGQQTLSISNIGFGTLNWVLDNDCSWLQVDPNSGSSTGEADINHVTLDVDITDLAPGIHNCELTISDPCAINSPQIVSVTLGVLYVNGDGNQLHVPSEYETIQAAIDDCNEGDTVVIASGTYTGSGNRDLDFKGKAITVRSTNPDNRAVVAATIIDCQGTLLENHRGFYFYNNEQADSVLEGLTIINGYALFGGAILCQNSSPSIINCNFVNNFASFGGGVIENEYGSNPILSNCAFRGNSATNWGSAIRNHTSCPMLINCLVTDNSAKYGGGMQNENSSSNPTLINCTFTGNTASGWGGGIINAGVSPAASPVLTNCIFWGNSDGGGMDESAQIHGGSPVINYSCIQGWTGDFGGTGNIGSDPCFVDVGNPDPNLWNLRLKPDSPCIDEGDNNAASPVATDLTGYPRIIDGDCDDADVIDMGAYEFNYAYMGDLDYSCIVDFFDFSIFGQAWMTEQGDPGWDWACNISGPPDDYIDWRDVAVICENWLASIGP